MMVNINNKDMMEKYSLLPGGSHTTGNIKRLPGAGFKIGR